MLGDMSDGSERRPASARPFYLWLALGVLTFWGLGAINHGLFTIQLVRSPPTASTLAPPDLASAIANADLAARVAHARQLAPVGIAQLLLGGLLLWLAVRAMFGGRVRLGLLMQALLANFAVVIVDFVMSRPVRAATVDAVIASGVALPNVPDGQAPPFAVATLLWWSLRLRFALELGLLFACTAMLCLRRSREHFADTDAAAREA
jgi:hypothetical protein